MKYLLFSSFFLIVGILSYSQQPFKKSDLPGTYQFLNDDSLFRLSIVLNKDHSFLYNLANDLTEKSSEGTWRISRDTLMLNTYNQMAQFKIKVKETETVGKLIKLGDIQTRTKKLLPTALVSINGDTTKLYDALDNNNTFHPGEIKTLSVFVGRARSELYPVKNLRANRIDIMLDMDQSPADYFFMENAKFLLVRSAILPVRDNQVDSVTSNMNKRIPIALVKIK